jgi:hypothetical protein
MKTPQTIVMAMIPYNPEKYPAKSIKNRSITAGEAKDGVIYAETEEIATITIIVILEIPASTAASPKIKDPTSPAASPTVRGILTPTSLISSNKTSINSISQNIDTAEFSSKECINSKSFFGKV